MIFNKHLNKYYKKYMLFFLIGFVALIAVNYFQLLIPDYLGAIVDLCNSAAKTGGEIDKDALMNIIWGTVVVALVMCFGRITWRLSLFNMSQRVESGLRLELFQKSERLSQRYYHETKVGTIMAWFTNDLETVEEFLGWGTVMLVDAIFLSILCIYKMIMLDWVMAIMISLPILLIIIWGGLVEKYMAINWDRRQEAFDSLYDYSQETFTGIRVIKAFVKETQYIHEFAKVAKKNKDQNIKFVRINVIFDVLIEIIITLIVALMFGIGGFFVYMTVSGNPVTIFNHTINLTSGNLLTYIGYFDTLIWPMIALGSIISMRSRCKTSLKRIGRFLDEEEEIHDEPNSKVLENVKGKITFNHFNFKYPTSEKVSLEDINLTINPGEMIGIVGKIGYGKTTLVNSLFRLFNVEKNSILIDDNDIMDCTLESVRSAISYVPQDNFLFSDTVKNNIAFAVDNADMEKIKEAAMFSDVDSNIEEFKDKYETVIGERGTTLSGGQKQRVSISRAFLKNAPIMILDDSVSAVDVKTETTILKNIREKRAGKTTIVIASRVSTVAHMDKIIVLNDGKVEAFDTPENLSKISPTYQKMVYLQTLEREVEGGGK